MASSFGLRGGVNHGLIGIVSMEWSCDTHQKNYYFYSCGLVRTRIPIGRSRDLMIGTMSDRKNLNAREKYKMLLCR